MMDLYGGHEHLEGWEKVEVIVSWPHFAQWEAEFGFRGQDVVRSLDEAPISNKALEAVQRIAEASGPDDGPRRAAGAA